MSISEVDQRCAKLRQKLKEWEASFAAAHDGRKPSREDVKQDVKIAQRYKDYNKFRERLSRPQSTRNESPRKRSSSILEDRTNLTQTPRKRQKQLPDSHPAVVDPYDPPISFLLSPNQHRSCIGPTPQKDGRVLGMFDALSDTTHSKTPARRKSLSESNNVQPTPSKVSPQQGKATLIADKMDDNLDVKVTPSIQRIIKSTTPGSRNSIRKLRFDTTPAFLRRDSQTALAPLKENDTGEADIQWSPIANRQLRRPLGRSLSAIVKGLRDMEEEQLDEELDLMREMEGVTSSKVDKGVPRPQILVEDSQQIEMPLGPDQGPTSEDDLDQQEQQRPNKTWKKRGQKRTTRKVNIRPNTTKWKPEPKWKGDESEILDELGGDRVPDENERKPQSQIKQRASDGEFSTDEDTGNESDALGLPKKKANIEAVGKDGALTKAKRKISATAHANFRALKIKNKNSKGKGRGRFGRRR